MRSPGGWGACPIPSEWTTNCLHLRCAPSVAGPVGVCMFLCNVRAGHLGGLGVGVNLHFGGRNDWCRPLCANIVAPPAPPSLASGYFLEREDFSLADYCIRAAHCTGHRRREPCKE